MQSRHPRTQIILLSAVFILELLSGASNPAVSATRKLLRPLPSYSTIAAVTAKVLPRLHLEKPEINDEISRRTLKLYLMALDYQKSYFLAADIKAMERFNDKLDDALQAGDLSFGFKTYELYLRRVRQRVAFIEETMRKGFDLSKEEDYEWQRKDADWAQTEAELDEIWRKRLKNEYIVEVMARMEREKAKKQIDSSSAPAGTTSEAGQPGLTGESAVPRSIPRDEATAGASGSNQGESAGEAAKGPGSDGDVSDAVAAAASTTVAGATGEVSGATSEAEADEDESYMDLSPEEAIIKRYKQQRTVLEDNDAEWVLQTYLSAMVRSLDPHSSYMSPSEEKDFDIAMKLSLFGIGALLSPDEGAAKVVRLIPGGPAAKDGRLKAGDRIIGVGQGDGPVVNTVHWPLSKTVKLIRGRKGSKVVLLIRKGSAGDAAPPERIDLIRDEVKLEEQAAKGEIKEISAEGSRKMRLGVISLPAFYMDFSGSSRDGNDYRSSTKDVMKILEDFKKSPGGIDGVVMDLRNNGGGSLQEAVSMTGLFIDNGPVVQVKQNQGAFFSGTQVLKDEDSSIEWGGPLVVLVSRVSASASEIFAGAVKDYNRGLIIGDSSTHGKGSVQTIYPISKFVRSSGDDAMGSLKVTMAQFYRINGESTQRKGVRSDITIPSVLEYMELGEDKQDFALPFHVIDATDFKPKGIISQGLVDGLLKKSLDRRDSDSRFVARRKLIEKIKARQDEKKISLNLDARMAQREIERKLMEEQDRLSQEAIGQGDETKKGQDLVLEESLRILVDLAVEKKDQ